jgi:UDP-N-acetylmuramyl pentapeptide synthase
MLKHIVITIITWEARLVLARFKPGVIAITGSVGKTTTKDAVFAAVSAKLRARKSVKSANSEIGVPLTILGLGNAWNSPWRWALNIVKGAGTLMSREYPEWLVLEVGADHPGDIRALATWLRPDIAIITGVPDIPVHVENFRSPDELLREKRALAEYLKPGGKLIVNGDDPRMRALQGEFRGVCIRYGLSEENDFFASHGMVLYEANKPIGLQCRVNHAEFSIPVTLLGGLGRPRMYAAAAALAAASAAGVDEVSAAQELGRWAPPPGRERIIAGERGAVIIDDTYNSSPVAAHAALDTLKEVNATRRIAMLGDMMELGKYSADAHRQVGIHAAQVADILITVGVRARKIAEAARDAGMPEGAIRQYEMDEAARAGDELEEELREGDVVLVKGSQAVRMEKTVLEMMAEPERAAELLVRMEPEWQFR